MDDKEHPASVAGRYVRAAGVAIRKERERLAAESARRAAEAAQQAPPVPPQAAAPPSVAVPTPAASPAVAPPPQKPARAARAQLPPPTPRPLVDRLLYIGFVITIVATGLAALNVDVLTSGTTQVVIRVVLGCIFLSVSLVLLTNWHRATERLVARLMKKFWGMDHPVTRSGRFMRRIARDLMTLLGIAWLAIGVFEILRAFVNT